MSFPRSDLAARSYFAVPKSIRSTLLFPPDWGARFYVERFSFAAPVNYNFIITQLA